MNAIILAAGVGSRLAPLTNETPKALINVINKPILLYQIESYLYAGIENITIVAGYKAEKIKEYIDYLDYKNINIIYNDVYSSTNNMFSLYLALKSLHNTETVFISNADVVYEKDMIKFVNSSGLKNFIVYDKGNFNEESMKITVNNDNTVNKISKQIFKEAAAGTSIDLYKFDAISLKTLKKVIENYINNDNNNLWTEVAINDILSLTKINCVDIQNRIWYEIDNFEDLKNAETILNNRKQ